MTKILLAGDTHGSSSHTHQVFLRAAKENADMIIQLGDFGFGWATDSNGSDLFTTFCSKQAEQHNIPLYWLGGNHENYDALEHLVGSAPPDVTEIAPQVYYLARGATLTFDGLRFLFCGGATSVDKRFRVEGLSWWRGEEIMYADVDRCKATGPADILITHDFPWECNIVDRHLDPYWGPEAQEKTVASRQKISTILANCGARYMFHGHLHVHYKETVKVNNWFVDVMGLDCDGTPLARSTYLLDTQDYLTRFTQYGSVEDTKDTESNE